MERLGKATSGMQKQTYDPSVLDEGWQEGLVGTFYYVRLGIDAEEGRMLRTRMFGSKEDPATGSVPSALASWLSLQEERGRVRERFGYVLTQGVEMGRRSEIGVEVWKNKEGEAVERVVLSGEAVPVMEGWVDI